MWRGEGGRGRRAPRRRGCWVFLQSSLTTTAGGAEGAGEREGEGEPEGVAALDAGVRFVSGQRAGAAGLHRRTRRGTWKWEGGEKSGESVDDKEAFSGIGVFKPFLSPQDA